MKLKLLRANAFGMLVHLSETVNGQRVDRIIHCTATAAYRDGQTGYWLHLHPHVGLVRNAWVPFNLVDVLAGEIPHEFAEVPEPPPTKSEENPDRPAAAKITGGRTAEM